MTFAPASDTNADATVGAGATAPSSALTDQIGYPWTLVLIRHAQTAWNAEGRIQGQRDVPLSPTGREQASLLGSRLRAACRPINPRPLIPRLAGNPLEVAAQFTSDLSRATETARIAQIQVPALESLPLITTPLLRERHFGEWEGMEPGELRARRRDSINEPPGGETEAEVFERMGGALRVMMNYLESMPTAAGGVTLVYGHGGSLRALLCLVLGLGAAGMRCFRLENTSLSVVEFAGIGSTKQNGRVACVNDTAHLCVGDTTESSPQ